MAHTTQKRILLVEDEALIALSERQVLTTAGYHVEVATDGEQAIEIVETAPMPDLILMDIDLGPGIDGTETARRILERYRVPIVFLSSHAEPEIVARTETITSYGYIQKGTADTILVASVRMAFKLWDAHQQIVESEATRANLFEQVPGAIYQYRYYPDGSSRFPMASRNIQLVYEVTPEEVVDDATPVFNRIHPEDVESVSASIRRSYDTLEIWEEDYRVILPSRGERWLRGRAQPERLEDGSVLWHGFISDITDYRTLRAHLVDDRRRLAAILDGTNVGTWEWNVQTGRARFNERWAEMIGYTLEELAPVSIDTWRRFAHPEDLRRSEQALEDHFSGRTPRYDVEARMKHRDGHWVWVRDRGKVASWSADGHPEWVYGTHEDISETKEREAFLSTVNQQLEQSEARYRSLFERSASVMLVIDPATGAILQANPSAERYLGRSASDLTASTIYRICDNPPEDVRRVVADAQDGESNPVHLRLRRSDGAVRTVEVFLSAIQWEQTDALHAIVHDVTRRIELERERAKLSTAVAHSANAVVVTDKNGYIEYANARFTELTGYPIEEVTGRKTNIMDSLVHSPEDYATLWNTILSGQVYRGTFYNKKESGVRYWESASIAPIHDRDGEITNFVKIAEDVTERIEREQLLQETARKLQEAVVRQETLMAELNHRVKNHLAMVAALVRLEDGRLGDAADLTDILSRITTITAIHEQLQTSTSYDTVDLRPYVTQVVSLALGTDSAVEQVLEVESISVPTKVASTLGLILNEIATNAVKYGFNPTEPRRFSVRVTTDGSWGTITVTNSGNPFPEDLQLENSPSLGLRLVSMLVQQIGGDVSLTRTPQPLFTIRFPLEQRGPAAINPAVDTARTGHTGSGSPPDHPGGA